MLGCGACPGEGRTVAGATARGHWAGQAQAGLLSPSSWQHLEGNLAPDLDLWSPHISGNSQGSHTHLGLAPSAPTGSSVGLEGK